MLHLMSTLRADTRDQHLAVETALRLPGRVRTRTDLVAVLSALLACWDPLERALAGLDWAQLRLDRRLGESADLLRADLAALGAPAPAGGDLPAVPDFTGLDRAVGGRYVLLGSALGGRIIAPGIECRLGLRPAEATAFFRRHDRDPGRDWARFRAAVGAREWTAEETARAVAAARATFDVIRTTAVAVLRRHGHPASTSSASTMV